MLNDLQGAKRLTYDDLGKSNAKNSVVVQQSTWLASRAKRCWSR